MKKILLIITLSTTAILHGQPGMCMQIGNRLTEKHDTKTLNFVSCNCPCNEYQTYDARSQCSQCKHYHMPHRTLLLKNIDFKKARELELMERQQEIESTFVLDRD